MSTNSTDTSPPGKTRSAYLSFTSTHGYLNTTRTASILSNQELVMLYSKFPWPENLELLLEDIGFELVSCSPASGNQGAVNGFVVKGTIQQFQQLKTVISTTTIPTKKK